jgi:pteridine reductase
VEAFEVQADLSSAEGCRRLSSAVADRWRSLDVLVNNASLFEPRAFDTIDDQTWQQVIEVNLLAPARLSRDLLPLLRVPSEGGAAGACGVVVHLCDIGSERPLSGYAHYSVSKAGLVMLVKAMAVELAPDVRTVGVSPGQVVWPENYDEATRERLTSRVPMGRVGTVDEVAALVRVLVTESTYLNGVVVPIDGGLSCRY